MMDDHDDFISQNQKKAKSMEPYSRNHPNSGGILIRKNRKMMATNKQNHSFLLPSIVSENQAMMKTFETSLIKIRKQG